MTIYLKAADEATFIQALKEFKWAWDTEYYTEVDNQGNEIVTDNIKREAGINAYTATHSLDVVGTIYIETGNTLTSEPDENGNTFEYPETAPIDGYHANLLLHGEDMPEELTVFAIDSPATPYRKFA